MSKFLTALAFGAALLLSAIPGFCQDFYEDPATGQIYTKPAEGRVSVGIPVEKIGGLYEDASGAIYNKPGEGRTPVAMTSEAAAQPQSEPAETIPDYSTQAFAEAVKHVIGEEQSTAYPKIKLGALSYINYSYDFRKEVLNPDGSRGARNSFDLTRGYLNLTADLTPEIFFRFTPDITRVSNKNVGASDASPNGDFELRVKYLYVGFKDFLNFYPSFQVKLGQFQGAWLDHEEALWTYRVQGTMLIEREGFMNSANLGVDLQGKLPEGYGEWQAVACNGEGYHQAEQNKFKSLQARLTLHPLPKNDLTKGLELTGFTFFGRKDSKTSRDMYDFLLGYKYHNDLFLGCEYLLTHGPDTYVTESPVKNNLDGGGLSLMGWYRMPFWSPIRIMGRWDHFDHDTDSPDNTINRYIYGVSYDLGKYVTFLLDQENTVTKNYRGGFNKKAYPDTNLLKVDVQVQF